MSSGKTSAIYVATFFGVLAAVTALTIEQGWVLSILWGWFAVPLGAPAISIPGAIGMAILLSTMLMRRRREESDEPWYEAFVFHATKPLVALGIGWIVKQFL